MDGWGLDGCRDVFGIFCKGNWGETFLPKDIWENGWMLKFDISFSWGKRDGC